MAFRCIIKFDGIQGTSELKPGFIDVLHFNWNVHNNVKAWEKAPSGTANVGDFSLTKRFDPSSPDLFTHCVNGKKVGTVEVSLVHSSGDSEPKEFANYKFETCYITSVVPGGQSGEGDVTEQVTFNYAKAEYGYGPKKASFDVGPGGIQGQ